MSGFTVRSSGWLHEPQLVEALLEHEGHQLFVMRDYDAELGPTIVVKCYNTRCQPVDEVMRVVLESVAQEITVGLKVRAWFPEEMPTPDEIGASILEALHKDFKTPDGGDAWWVDELLGCHLA